MERLVKCRAGNTEIDKNAITCPKCGELGGPVKALGCGCISVLLLVFALSLLRDCKGPP